MAISERYVSASGLGAHDGTSEANAFSWTEMITDINLGTRSGLRYNVIQGTGILRNTSVDTISSGSASLTAPLIIRGYKTVIGDGYLGRVNGNGPLIKTNMPLIRYSGAGGLVLGQTAGKIFESFEISGTNAGVALNVGVGNIATRNTLSSTRAGGTCWALIVNSSSCAYDNDINFTSGSIAGIGGAGAIELVNNGLLIGNRITARSTYGVTAGPGAGYIVNNLLYNCDLGGIVVSNTTALIEGNTIVNNSGHGIYIPSGASSTLVTALNNIITNNGGYGIYCATGARIHTAFNFISNNISGDINNNSGVDWFASINNSIIGRNAIYTNSGNGIEDYNILGPSEVFSSGLFNSSIGCLQAQPIRKLIGIGGLIN